MDSRGSTTSSLIAPTKRRIPRRNTSRRPVPLDGISACIVRVPLMSWLAGLTRVWTYDPLPIAYHTTEKYQLDLEKCHRPRRKLCAQNAATLQSWIIFSFTGPLSRACCNTDVLCRARVTCWSRPKSDGPVNVANKAGETKQTHPDWVLLNEDLPGPDTTPRLDGCVDSPAEIMSAVRIWISPSRFRVRWFGLHPPGRGY